MNKKTNWPLTIVLIILSPVLLPLIFFCLLLLLIAVLLAYLLVYFAIWVFWLTGGKDVLFVYSDSPIWRDYMLAEMLPLVKNEGCYYQLVRTQYMGTMVAGCDSLQALCRT